METDTPKEFYMLKIKILLVYIISSEDRLKFKVDVFDDYKIQTYGRSLNKSKTKYDTHLQFGNGGIAINT